ncbi:MAG: FIMAH domain-containing protein, partial [Nitrososphaerales archaeon]
YVMNADGAGQTNLSINAAPNDTDPDWQSATPAQATQNLIDDINNMNLDSKVEKKLIHHLDKALKELTDNKPKNDKVCHELDKFIKEVGKEENKDKLTVAQALQLTQSADAIKANLGCP